MSFHSKQVACLTPGEGSKHSEDYIEVTASIGSDSLSMLTSTLPHYCDFLYYKRKKKKKKKSPTSKHCICLHLTICSQIHHIQFKALLFQGTCPLSPSLPLLKKKFCFSKCQVSQVRGTRDATTIQALLFPHHRCPPALLRKHLSACQYHHTGIANTSVLRSLHRSAKIHLAASH